MNNELYHHGILGQKWGVRRYQNPDGSLTEEGRKRYGVGYSKYLTKRDFVRNLDLWGSKPDKNMLVITGHSGSGKSTLAYRMADKYNADVISLDAYYDNPIPRMMNEGFNEYLTKHVPDYNKIIDDFKKYDTVRFSEKDHPDKQFYWDTMDRVRDALFDYSKHMKENQKIIAEGVQFADTSMWPDSQKKAKSLDGVPIIIKKTPILTSTLRAAYRDNVPITRAKSYLSMVFKNQKAWSSGLKDLERNIVAQGKLFIEDGE